METIASNGPLTVLQVSAFGLENWKVQNDKRIFDRERLARYLKSFKIVWKGFVVPRSSAAI